MYNNREFEKSTKDLFLNKFVHACEVFVVVLIFHSSCTRREWTRELNKRAQISVVSALGAYGMNLGTMTTRVLKGRMMTRKTKRREMKKNTGKELQKGEGVKNQAEEQYQTMVMLFIISFFFFFCLFVLFVFVLILDAFLMILYPCCFLLCNCRCIFFFFKLDEFRELDCCW